MIERVTAARSAFAALLAFLAIAATLSASPALAAPEHPYLPDASHLEEFEESCGATTDPYGDLYVASLEGGVKVYGPSGALLTELIPFELGLPFISCSVAVGPEGAVYIAGYGIPREETVVKFVPEDGVFPPSSSTEYVLDESAGDEGVLVGEEANAVAVDSRTGDVYISEEGKNEVQRLTVPSSAQCSPGAKVVFAWTPANDVGTTEVPCGPTPAAIESALEDLLGAGAVNVLSGETSANTRRIEFTGKLGNTAFPVGALETREAGTGTVLFASTAQPNVKGAPSKISAYESDGTPVPGAIGTGVGAAAFYGVDVDAGTGRVYAVDTQNVLVDIFDPSVSRSTPVETIDGTGNPNFPAGFGELFQGFLAVDQTTGNFFVNNVGLSYYAHPSEGNGVIAEFTPTGGFVSQIGPAFGDEELEFGSELYAPIGLTVDDGLCSPNRGDVYVAANYENLYAFGPTSPFAPAGPSVTAIDPSQGPTGGGNTVTVTGTELGCADLPAGAVEFGDTEAADVEVNATGTELTATAPAHGAGTVDVTVTTPNGSSTHTAADEYTYFAAPTLASLSPNQGPSEGGNVVTVNGAELTGADEADGSVEFDGVPATAVSVNDAGTQLTATAPAHAAGVVDVTVTTPGGTTTAGAASKYTYVDPPTLTDCSPAAGPLSAGPQVSCTGTNLTGASFAFGAGNLASAVTVSLDGTEATMSPPPAPGAAPGVVAITAATAGGTAAHTVQYTYAALPVLSAVAPDKGPLDGGQTVTIEGSNLKDVTEVRFGSTVVSGPITEEGVGTKLTVTSPPASVDGPVDVRVRTAGGLSATGAASEYAYIAPLFLAVAKAGTGSGAVKCDGGPCASTYPYEASVTLEATADSGSTFAGFSGGGCVGTASCTVAIKARTTVTATFDAIPTKKEDDDGQTPSPPGEEGTARVAPGATVKAGKAKLNVSCPGPGSCKGTIKLTARVKVGKRTKTIVVGFASYEIPAGSSRVVEVKLSKAAKRRLKKGKLKVKVSGGGSVTLRQGG